MHLTVSLRTVDSSSARRIVPLPQQKTLANLMSSMMLRLPETLCLHLDSIIPQASSTYITLVEYLTTSILNVFLKCLHYF